MRAETIFPSETMFPKDFLWGSATSAHQVEGNNRMNDWWRWEVMGRAKEPSGDASGHYDLFESDFDIAKFLNQNAHRFSIEWSRVEPKEGVWDGNEIGHYRKVIRALHARGLTPLVTLHHFTLPLWLADKGGFLEKSASFFFERFAAKMAQEFSQDVHYWITINEPFVYAGLGYLEGKWPPGEKSFSKMALVIRNLLAAHGKAYHAINSVYKERRETKPEISMANNVFIFAPCSRFSLSDWLSAYLRDRFCNHLYFDAVKTGRLYFPLVFREDMPFAKGTFDFLGINYYSRQFIRNAGFGIPGIFGQPCLPRGFLPPGGQNTLGWEIYPEGIFDIVHRFYKRYNLPVIITENGASMEDDSLRWDFIKNHVSRIGEAIKKGARVKGYFYWSLLDNFEWADGFSPRFGLVEVDYKTRKRRIRDSARKYALVCKSGNVAARLGAQ